ncbi:MAG: hypothetical protein LBF89_12785 [Bacteroidales bacterium]|jgi:hypothetical protein|nr:hypothetical protein [Bacteroidales bacterium]
MEKMQVVKNIIFLPKRFYTERDVSMYSLLKESGYFELHNQISETDIIGDIIQHPECIDQWLILSADKRCSSGWYFEQMNNDKYIIGYYPPSSQENLKTMEYLNKFEACAAFIKREIEDIRKLFCHD